MIVKYSRKESVNHYLEDNFRVHEFACKDGTDTVLIDTTLTSVLQIVRNYFAMPVVISSAYRTKDYNKKVGGTKNSNHLTGQAADIYINGISAQKIYSYLCDVMIGWGGLIYYPKKGFVHVDTRKKEYREVKN